jgi:hypothetical protein
MQATYFHTCWTREPLKNWSSIRSSRAAAVKPSRRALGCSGGRRRRGTGNLGQPPNRTQEFRINVDLPHAFACLDFDRSVDDGDLLLSILSVFIFAPLNFSPAFLSLSQKKRNFLALAVCVSVMDQSFYYCKVVTWPYTGVVRFVVILLDEYPPRSWLCHTDRWTIYARSQRYPWMGPGLRERLQIQASVI